MRILKIVILSAIRKLGYEIYRIAAIENEQVIEKAIYPQQPDDCSGKLKELGINKAHYGCGPKLFGDGWANIDSASPGIEPSKVYIRANLTSKHLFPSDFFKFSFAEDFIEHLDQSESIVFLAEAFRTLQPGGVLRLSFPGFREVLQRHYKSSDFEGTSAGNQDAYTHWGHRHFYCEDSLSIVARHIGFSDIEFVKYGKSKYEEFHNLDTRSDQKDLNIYVELRK
jgi:predicted SAM-dependent methyltransferase